MKVIPIASLCLLLLVTGCQSKPSHPLQSRQAAEGDWSLPYKQWYFYFFTPYTLYAMVSYAHVIDTDGYLYRFFTLDRTQSDPNVKGTWSEKSYRSSMRFNKVKKPPQYMAFCWDSVIDRKTYETHIVFSPDTWRRMQMQADHLSSAGRIVWYNTLLIGLAPEGTVRLWLQDVGGYPNLPVKPISLTTRSGDEMDICKNIPTKIDFSYSIPDGYDAETKEFIKGKTYPYGDW
ncbi:DUF2931 family protein [Phytobacter sp. V91]|uniref:DUF2931 family protein n=1 Tax=Phytobacter sp. V91 TaxID=3369425 RepID=UPI003F615270